MLDDCWIICSVFVFMDESGRLGVKDSFDEDSFRLVSFALVEGKYCRIEFVVFVFWIEFVIIIIIIIICS